MEKLCVFCKHFYLDMGYPDLSDVTPGQKTCIECSRGHWKMGYYEDVEEYRQNIMRAESCEDFELYEEEEAE